MPADPIRAGLLPEPAELHVLYRSRLMIELILCAIGLMFVFLEMVFALLSLKYFNTAV